MKDLKSMRFVIKPTQFDIFDVLILSRDTKSILLLGFKHGAYIAGGFARLIAQWKLGMVSENEFKFRVTNHMGTLDINNLIDRDSVSWKRSRAGRGDIDLFFRSKESIAAFFDELQNLTVQNYIVSSPGGNAQEIVVNDFFRIQVITKVTGSPIQVLSGFDIVNSMVAFDASGNLIMHSDWEQLEKTTTLSVNDIQTPYTMYRVFKYFARKGYVNLTPESSNILTKFAINFIDQTKNKSFVTKSGESFESTFRDRLNFNLMIPALQNIDLMLISSIYGQKAYSSIGKRAFKTVIDRVSQMKKSA